MSVTTVFLFAGVEDIYASGRVYLHGWVDTKEHLECFAGGDGRQVGLGGEAVAEENRYFTACQEQVVRVVRGLSFFGEFYPQRRKVTQPGYPEGRCAARDELSVGRSYFMSSQTFSLTASVPHDP